MNAFKKTVIASLVGVSLLVSGSIMAHGQKRGGEKMVSPLPRCDMSKLQLTDNQKKQIAQMKQSRVRELQESRWEQIRKDRDTYREQSRALIQEKSFDENKAGVLINAQISKDSERQAQRQLAQMKARHNLFQMLNKKQQEIWLKECSIEVRQIGNMQKKAIHNKIYN